MKKERVLCLLFILTVLFTITLTLAVDDTKEIDKSYSCLKTQLGDNCGDTQNTAQAAFSLLAMASDSGIQSDCRSSLDNNKQTDCWSDTSTSTTCTIKSTALASLALRYVNSNVDDSVEWLKDNRKLATELNWYLEIDSINETACTINGQEITIGDNKKISGTNPSGLSKAYNNYWFKIDDTSINYTVSCDREFITTLLYKKPSSGVYYVSSETHSAPASDSTTEYVNGYCFSTSSACDYEGSLWATLALLRAGEDITPYIPYLTAMSDDTSNIKYIPLAFLYMLDNNADDYLAGLLSLQKQNKYWEVSGNKFYDTSIALLAMQSQTSIQQAISAKAYLLTQRNTDGCWPTDTAMLLYSGWPKSPAIGPAGNKNCEDFNYTCTSSGECSVSNVLDNFDCTSLSQVCCSIAPVQLTCEGKDGMICKDDEECSVLTVPASDTSSCCVGGSCQKISTTNDCTDNEGTCQTSCSSNEQEKTAYENACGIGEVCCGVKTSSSVGWWLIILLIILIILIVLAIIFRNQLKIWWFKMKTKFSSKKGPEPTTRPPVSSQPYPSRPSAIPRQIMPRSAPPPARPTGRPPIRPSPARPAGRPQKDKEFDDTMKKLRDMSK